MWNDKIKAKGKIMFTCMPECRNTMLREQRETSCGRDGKGYPLGDDSLKWFNLTVDVAGNYKKLKLLS